MDLDTRQVAEVQENYPIPFPAVLVAFNDFAYKERTHGGQEVHVNVSLNVWAERYSDHFTDQGQTSRQLVALNWHQFFEMKKSTSTKKEVRGKRGGHGEVLFDEFYSMRIEDLELQFGLRKNAGKYPMYYMKEIE